LAVGRKKKAFWVRTGKTTHSGQSTPERKSLKTVFALPLVMKIGASTVHGFYRHNILDVVLELEEAGFDTIELVYERGKPFSSTEITELRKIREEAKKDFSMHCPFIGMMLSHPNEEYWKPQLERIEKSLQIACEIGCSDYVIHAGEIPEAYRLAGEPRESFVYSFVERFAPLVERYKPIKVRIENLIAEKEIGATCSELAGIIEAIPSLGLCYDIAHAVLAKQAEAIMNSFPIDYVHATDNDLIVDQHWAVGAGKIDFKKIISSLKSKNNNTRTKIIVEGLSYQDDIVSYAHLRELV
jgi:sugar phosphate isomerase/epimerase